MDAEANAFYVSPAQSEVETWTMAGIDYCASTVGVSCTPAPGSQAPVTYGLRALNAAEGWNEIAGSYGLSGVGNICAPSYAAVDTSMTSSIFCATDNPSGGQSGSQETDYNPTGLTLSADGTLTETIAAQTVGSCNSRLQLRAQLIKWDTPEGSPDPSLATAALFAPLLYFDSGEKWRPLNIDRFLAEQFPPTVVTVPSGAGPVTTGGTVSLPNGHKVCGAHAPLDCRFTSGSGDLAGPYGASDYLDINGSGAPSNYASPNPACNQNGLQDCNTGPASSIYYHVVNDSTSAYTYYDYWIFYRFNDFYYNSTVGGIDEHEGDWEGYTVAPSLTTPDTFDFASFSQHGNWYSYARDVLSCDGARQSGTCQGANNTPSGARVDDFPTAGGHTNYPTECSSFCFQDNGPHVPLLGLPLLPEASHDGSEPWGNNYALTQGALVPLPPVGHLRWVDFPGRWGNSSDPTNNSVSAFLGAGDGTAPLSPGCQAPHFSAPDQGGGMQDGCGSVSGQSYPSDRMPRTAPDPTLGTRTSIGPRECPDWFASDVAALVCDQARLSAAITNGTLGTVPYAQIMISGDPTGGGQGVTQALGQPLQAGQSVSIRLPATGSQLIAVHWIDANGVPEIYSTTIPVPAGQLARLTVPLGGGAPQVTLSP